MGRKRDVIGLNAHTGEACFTVYYSKFNILIVPGYISTIPLRRNFYRPRKYLFLYNFLPASIAPYEKSLYVRTSFSIRFNFREQLKFSYFILEGRAITD